MGTRARDTGKNELDDVGLFLQNLSTLNAAERKVSLQLLAVACVVDGKLTTREKQLWREVMTTVGRKVEFKGLKRLLAAFIRGDGFVDAELRSMDPGPG